VDNGGPTLTHTLSSASPARNAGDPAAVPGASGVPMYDQRGLAFSRVIGGRIDMGAVERSAVSANFDFDDDVDGADFLIWQRGRGTAAPNGRNSTGDADIDTDVDAADLTIWRTQFGTTAPAAAAQSNAMLVIQSPVKPTTDALTSEAPSSRSTSFPELADAALAAWFNASASSPDAFTAAPWWRTRFPGRRPRVVL
jgi:hypothetical protein